MVPKSTNQTKIVKPWFTYLANSNTVDWMEQTSTGAKQTNQVLIAGRTRMVQTTWTNVDDKLKYG